jgi:hypothetical protein
LAAVNTLVIIAQGLLRMAYLRDMHIFITEAA